MDPLAVFLIATLLAIGLLHLAWALGLNWPGRDGVSRAAYVVGASGRPLLGFFSRASIALAFFCAVGVVWMGQQPINGRLHAFIAYGGYLPLILVFSLRGLAPYLTPVFDYARGTPFHALSRRYHAPTWLVLGAGLVGDFPPGIDGFILSPVL